MCAVVCSCVFQYSECPHYKYPDSRRGTMCTNCFNAMHRGEKEKQSVHTPTILPPIRKDYYALARTQKSVRLHRAAAMLDKIGVPVAALIPKKTAIDVIHLQ